MSIQMSGCFWQYDFYKNVLGSFQFPSTIVTHKSEVIHPSITDSLDYEAELAIIIGESGSRIPESEALHHVFGYTVANDITARDWQKNKNGKQWNKFGVKKMRISTLLCQYIKAVLHEVFLHYCSSNT